MTRFATNFAATAAQSLTLQFGESIGYYNRAGDPVRNVMAMIDRNVEIISEAGIPGRADIIRVKNDASTGISSTEIDTGGDKVSFPLRVGETPAQSKSIVKVEATENGLVRFMVQ